MIRFGPQNQYVGEEMPKPRVLGNSLQVTPKPSPASPLSPAGSPTQSYRPWPRLHSRALAGEDLCLFRFRGENVREGEVLHTDSLERWSWLHPPPSPTLVPRHTDFCFSSKSSSPSCHLDLILLDTLGILPIRMVHLGSSLVV